MPRSIIVAVMLRVCSSRLFKSPTAPGCSSRSSSLSRAKALRRASCTDAAPPGSAQVRRCATRSNRRDGRQETHRPIWCHRCRHPCRRRRCRGRVYRAQAACGNRLCHDARDVRMMVLDFDKRQIVLPCLLARPLARQITGMHVACQAAGARSKRLSRRVRAALQASKVAPFSTSPICCDTKQAAWPSVSSRVSAIVAFAAARRRAHRRSVVERRQRQRLRRISACAAHGHDDPVDYAYHGVVVARQNRAVVAEQRIGDAGGNEMLPCKASSVSMGSSLRFPLVMTSALMPCAAAAASSKC